MKTKNLKKKVNKFDLEKFEVAKLKNMFVIKGGAVPGDDDPIDTNHGRGGSSGDCNR
jgi:hypothetical protein